MSPTEYDPNSLQDMLPTYYKRLFPHKPFFQWLSYGSSEQGVFSNREISFTLHDDIYLRYLCYDTASELEKDICTKNPVKIDIGAVLQNKPSYLKMSATTAVPVQRELVFDIDMTDYDDVRTCCEGAAICQKCWKFMIIACRILDAALREDFGFEHILWIFSGRRGIHCWVCDHIARHLDTKGRGAIADYLQLVSHITGSENTAKFRVNIGERLHHSVKRALRIIEPLFEEIVLVDQNLFGPPNGVNKLLQMIQDEGARKELESFLKKQELPDSKTVWTNFTKFVNFSRSQSASVWSRKLRNIVEEIQLGILYPRLDINVTKGFNHLLKAPFCIHPATGKLCVPFNPGSVAKFDPMNVPTIVSLMKDVNEFDDKNKNEDGTTDRNRIKDYKKTGMFKAVVVFEAFLRNSLVKELFLMLPDRCEQYIAGMWLGKLSEPVYNANTLRQKRNQYLLMLSICMSLSELRNPFDKPPPDDALQEITCFTNPRAEPCPNTKCEKEKEEEVGRCDLHANNTCPEDKENIGKVLDKQYNFIMELCSPKINLLSDPAARRRARKWKDYLNAIDTRCYEMKGLRNDYAMLLSGYLLNDELPGPFVQLPIDKLLPLEEMIRTVQMDNYMSIDPSHPNTMKFFRDVPHPEEGAFAFVSITGEICDAFMQRREE